MSDPLPRWLLALTAIIAIVAICIGVKDYVQKKATPPTSAASVVDSTPTTRSKKATSKRTGQRARSSNARAAATQLAADKTEKPLACEELANTSANAVFAAGSEANTVAAQTAQDDDAAAPGGSAPTRNQLDSFAMHGCLPLPNQTKPGDVDAPYYWNWARTYCGI